MTTSKSDLSGESVRVPPNDERFVMVGTQRCKVSVDEWVATQLRENERVRITPNRNNRGPSVWGNQPREPYEAIVRGTWFYDGVILTVEQVCYSSLVERSVHPEFDGVEPLDRAVHIDGPSDG